MVAMLTLCQNNDWKTVLERVKTDPWRGTAVMKMHNYIRTTVCHQALTSKADVKSRVEVILQVLSQTPRAAEIKNGYGSLCLHCACQRNLKMDAKTKEKVILALIKAFPGGLVKYGGVARRTPLHVIFTGESFSGTCLSLEKHLI
jgi:hypothetical protein